jgi:phosphoribosylglycinamide formyltransferase 1
MKLVIFTSNGIRHKFLANSLVKNVEDAIIVSECNTNDMNDQKKELDDISIKEHFKLRGETEKKFFPNNNYFSGKVIPLIYREANLHYIYEIIKEFNPDLMIVFGSSIIKEPLLSLKPNKFINLHLGISPYYKGSGTNFWPFVNQELEYVGSTILHLDPGIDTGDIITHVRPKIEIDDNVHTVGCKVIKESVSVIIQIIEKIRNGENLKRVKQWEEENEKYYKNKDFNKDILLEYMQNLENGLVKRYLKSDKEIKLISLDK